MRFLLGFAVCFAFILSGCSGEDVKTDIKNVKPQPAVQGPGRIQGKSASRMVNP
jgi:hypothetical protein